MNKKYRLLVSFRRVFFVFSLYFWIRGSLFVSASKKAEASGFTHGFAVETGSESDYYIIELTPEIFKYAENNFSDLRMYTETGELVQYFLTDSASLPREKRAPTIKESVDFLMETRDKKSFISFSDTMKNKTISNIRFQIDEVFKRDFYIQNDSNYYSSLYRSDMDNEVKLSMDVSEISMNIRLYPEDFVVVIENYDSPSVVIQDIIITYDRMFLVCKGSKESMYLYVGEKDQGGAPFYDIHRYKAEILQQHNFLMGTIQETDILLEKTEKEGKSFAQIIENLDGDKVMMWSVGIVSVVLVGIIIMSVSKPRKSE